MSSQTFTPSSQTLILFAIGLLLSGISYLVQTKNQKKAIRQNVAAWLPNVTRGRRTSTSKTPPRSLTPEKKVPSNVPLLSAYRDIFPPSTRGNLPIWTKSWKSLVAGLKSTNGEAKINQVVTAKNVIGFEQDYREASPSTYTPMGISIAEVKALGDFPEYSKLSGVPLPKAYAGFNLETAIPRPYRPFRWAYHQTMCRYSFMLDTRLADECESFEQNGA